MNVAPTTMETKIVLTYFIYLPIALVLTFYVARTLFTNGRIFMLDIFKGKNDIADATNKLFEVGFYLLNIGFALLILKIDQGSRDLIETVNGIPSYTFSNPLDSNQKIVEVLANKLGGFAIYLGVMLFLNLYLFFRGRKKSRMNQMPNPIPVLSAPGR